MWSYDAESFDPPAPVVDAKLTFGEKQSLVVKMQIDSGADLTCIPRAVVPTSDELQYGRTLVAGYEGKVSMKKTCYVGIRIGKHRFEDVEALPIDGDVGLIGRDVLSFLIVTLDGPGSKLLVENA